MGLVELHLGSRETEAAMLWGDLETAALPLHQVMVADHTFVAERADAFEMFGSGTPSGRGFPWSARKAAVAIGYKTAQHAVGRVQVASALQP